MLFENYKNQKFFVHFQLSQEELKDFGIKVFYDKWKQFACYSAAYSLNVRENLFFGQGNVAAALKRRDYLSFQHGSLGMGSKHSNFYQDACALL